RIGEVVGELLLIPRDADCLHRAAITETRDRARLPANDAAKRRADPIAAVRGMAHAALREDLPPSRRVLRAQRLPTPDPEGGCSNGSNGTIPDPHCIAPSRRVFCSPQTPNPQLALRPPALTASAAAARTIRDRLPDAGPAPQADR